MKDFLRSKLDSQLQLLQFAINKIKKLMLFLIKGVIFYAKYSDAFDQTSLSSS